jgi:hypothetical protein
MRYNFFIVILILNFFIGCNGSEESRNDEINSKTTENIKTDSIKLGSTDCERSIRDFLSWYKANFNVLNTLQLVDLIEDSSTARYRLIFANAEKYINQLQSSGFFSEKFLTDKMRYFKEKDQSFLKNNQSDGPPLGFESDLLLFTQEPEILLGQSNSLKVEQISASIVRLNSIENNLFFHVVTEGDRCVIDKIEFRKK